MKNLNLLQIVPSLESGGVEQGTVDIAKGLIDNGYNSFVASNGGRMVHILEKYKAKHFKLPLHSKNPITIFLNIFKLKKIIANNNINIMHVRSRAPAWSASFCKSNTTKLVSTFHNIYGHLNILKRKYNQSLANSDQIIANSDYVKNSIIKIYNIEPKKITVIHRGVDLDYFNPSKILDDDLINFMKKNLIPFDKKIILFPGRLSEWKGQLQFIETLKQIANQNIYCLFVGDNKNISYLKKLSQKIQKNNLEHVCKILGSQQNMPLIYKLSNIVVSAPLKAEGFGRIIAEAMAMKKLVIAYDFGGVKEQIKGLPEINRVTPLSKNELLNKIKQAIQIEEEEYTNLTNQYDTIILENFTKKQMIDKTINLYKSL